MQEIYVGPTLRKFSLVQNTIYRNGRPTNVIQAIEEIPEIEKLIVPVEEIHIARSKVTTPGSYEHKIFAAIVRKGNI